MSETMLEYAGDALFLSGAYLLLAFVAWLMKPRGPKSPPSRLPRRRT